MSEIVEQSPDTPSGSSRRAALKAGVGVGVGLLAWSGPTITSLGGTPAYALGCTFIVRVDLSGGCRNTDQGGVGCPFGYHELDLTDLPDGYVVTNNIPEGTCCNAGHVATLTFPAGITCVVVFRFHDPPQCMSNIITFYSVGPESDGSMQLPFQCPPLPVQPNDRYIINLTCNTTGAPPGCLT